MLLSIANVLKYVGTDEAAVKCLQDTDYGTKSLGQSSRFLESEFKRYCLRFCRIPESDSVK